MVSYGRVRKSSLRKIAQRGTYPPDELHELERAPISMISIKLNLSFSLLMELDLVEAKLKCPKQASQDV